MGKFSLENKIKDRLKGHEVHIDKRQLWKNLDIEEEERDRKVIWMWWFAGLAGLVFSVGIWWIVQKDGLEVSNIQESTLIEIDKNLEKTGNETISEISSSEKLSNIINDVKSATNKHTEESTPLINKERKSSQREVSSSKDFRNEPNRKKTTQKERIYNIKSGSESMIKHSELAVMKKAYKSFSKLLFIDGLPQVNSLLTFNREVETLSFEVNPMIKPIPEMRKFEFELYGGMGSNNRELYGVNSEFKNYIASRDSSERTIEHVSLGVSLKYILGGGFYGKAGLEVNRWNEKYTYDITSDTLETIVSIPDIILIDLQGNSTTKYTEGIQKSYNNINWVRYNRLTQIDFPVSLGYERKIKRWSLFGEASAIISMKQTFSGYLNTPSGELEKDPEYFKSSVGLNLGFNAGVGYGITPRLRARLSARYYQSLGSVIFPEFGLGQKYTSLGVRVGIGYLF